MTLWIVKGPIIGIVGATALGTLLAEATAAAPDYTTPSVIIGVLFAFIGTCAVVLYKVVLSPLFTVFVESLKNAELERTKYVENILKMNEQYGTNLTKQNELVGKIERQLAILVKRGNTATVSNET